ncbi:MAG TPA: MBL fold metallo-hydrolase [Chitinophagaceae bacterium]|nr:MBL fold metallo-hydrolase [Chitinophagaceae bacterium]
MQIQAFKIHKQIADRDVVLYPTLIEIKGRNYLVDCGYEETFPEFITGPRKLGVEVDDLYAILVSHDDIDHIGALKLFKDKNPNLIIYSSEVEERSISGEIKSERLEQAERSLLTITDEYKIQALQFIGRLTNMKRIKVDATLKDKDKIEDEVVVISTPGHTKGHISFYVPAKKKLIANDALVIEADDFDVANPIFTLDMNQAIKSVELINEIQPDKIICYHGGIAAGNISEKLNDVIAKYKNHS